MVKEGSVYGRELSLMFRDLRSLAVSNGAFFRGAPKGTVNERLSSAFSRLLDHLDHGVVRGVNVLLGVAAQFDFDSEHPGNGYRSMVTVIDRCCRRILSIARYVTVNRESYIFRANHYSRELEEFVSVLGQLRACLYYMEKLILYSDNGILFPDEDALTAEEYSTAEGLMHEVEFLSQEMFYGRCLGFQFCDSMVRPLTTINTAMACYGEAYQKSKSSPLRLAHSLLSCGKYLLNPELRAKQIVHMTRTTDIYFCKSFWSLPENSFMNNIPLYFCPSVAVNKVITIDPVPFDLLTSDGSRSLTVVPPSAHSGVGPVSARLISSEYRVGQECWFTRYGLRLPSLKGQVQKSRYLLIHCHGGGFVAQSSASHLMYLNFWANDLDIPILSVDYTLAPENYFPRQQEELFFAYCWALKNAHMLGSTAEKICIIGDSAGANIAVSLAMRLACSDIRAPDAVVSVYGGLVVRYSPSPSRILALMDPLLPLGVVALCLRAYTGDEKEDSGVENSNAGGLYSRCNNPQQQVSSPNVSVEASTTFSNGLLSSRDDSQLRTMSEPREVHGFRPPLSSQSPLNHRRLDSGFFDVNDQSDAGNSSSSLSNLTSRLKNVASDFKSSAAFVQKDLSDEDSDSTNSGTASCSSGEEGGSSQSFHSGGKGKGHSSRPYFRVTDDFSGTSAVCAPLPDSGSPLMAGYARLCHFDLSPMGSSKDIKNAKNPFVSPVLAPDNLLQKLCPVFVLGCHLDPLLDDSITFARRLKSLGKRVHLELISEVPHGFLNFVLVSSEAKAASGRCVEAIRQMLSIDSKAL